MNELKSKTAVITGAASGIGLAMARRFAAEGMRLVLADVEADALAAVGDALAADGCELHTKVLDVRDLSQVQALEAEAKERFGNIHVLCNNAGVGTSGPTSGIDDIDRWRWTIDVNLWGVIYGCKVFLPAMIEHGEPAHVVNTASMAGHIASPLMGAYNISKQGVVALSETMSQELQMAGASVGVSVLCPGFVRTGIADSERNLPREQEAAELPDFEDRSAINGIIKALVDGGIEADPVADAVVEAIKADSFWILTHPEMKPMIQRRAEEIVNGINPRPTVPTDA